MSNVCTDQTTFNAAFATAMNKYKNDEIKKNQNALYLMAVLYLIFTIWAIILAVSVEVNTQAERILHIFLAVAGSPLYVLSFYLFRKN